MDAIWFIAGALVALVSVDLNRRATEWLEKHPYEYLHGYQPYQSTGKRTPPTGGCSTKPKPPVVG